MYAVVRTGGKQYRVAKDAVLKVESLVETWAPSSPWAKS